LHGHNRPHVAQPVIAAVNVATASKVSIFFMVQSLLRKHPGALLLGSRRLIFRFRHLRAGQGREQRPQAGSIRDESVLVRQLLVCARTGWSSRQAQQLYTATGNVQTKRVNFFNTATAGAMKKCYTLRNFPSTARSRGNKTFARRNNRKNPTLEQLHEDGNDVHTCSDGNEEMCGVE
jgi:hypothetical protein